jgi:hypothetical protein
MKEDGQIPSSWIFLDNQYNEDLLDNICNGEGFMDIHCNAGIMSTNLAGDLPGYGKVWYNPNQIANILSLSRAKEGQFWVTFDSNPGNEFHLHKLDGNKHIFRQLKRGLY